MKKIIVLFVILFMLTACSENVSMNITNFKNKVNQEFKCDAMNDNNLFILSDKVDVYYWVYDKYNLCCSMYCDRETGKIKKYTISSDINNPNHELVYDTFKEIICKSNRNIVISNFEINGMIIDIFEDTHYSSTKEEPTLKNKINEEYLANPYSEKVINSQN